LDAEVASWDGAKFIKEKHETYQRLKAVASICGTAEQAAEKCRFLVVPFDSLTLAQGRLSPRKRGYGRLGMRSKGFVGSAESRALSNLSPITRFSATSEAVP
jgi:hypothetical protein